MNSSELIAKVASISGETRKAVEAVLKTTADVIAAELQEGGEVKLLDIGRLHAQNKAARTGRNPKTGDEIAIPARCVPKFTPAKALKEAVNA
jgi:DNA-binding protein HU-beta